MVVYFIENVPSTRDRSPINSGHNPRGRGRGRGRQARGRARGITQRQRPQRQQNFIWNQQYNAPAPRLFVEQHPGPTHRYPNGSQAGVFFDQYFTDEMWNIITSETNRYYVQQQAAEPNKHKTKWTHVTKEEMKAFVGIIIFMGIVKLPRINLYWSNDVLLHQEPVSSLMSQTRFRQIWRYFHLADNSTAPPRDHQDFDKIYRVRKYLELIKARSQALYRLSCELSIDETMVPHKGRLSYKQYIKNKPIKWGIKLWVLCEAKTGYVNKFQVYLGKEGNATEQNLARRVVHDLTRHVQHKYHQIYMDNFYSEPELFLQLQENDILACGTVRQNRKSFPKEIVLTKQMEKNMNRGDYLWCCHGNLVAMAWYDRRPVYLISTIHPPASVPPASVQRASRRGPREDIPCPPAQVDYQKFMGGVDLSDQICSTFSIIRKSRKAWKKLFYYGLEVSLMNSYIIYKQVADKPTEFLLYRLAIVRHLTEGKCFRQRPGRPSTRPLAEMDIRRLNGQYHSIAIEEVRRNCVVCTKHVAVNNLSRNQISKTNLVCVTCDRKPLCTHSKRNCWEKWHNLVEYWHK